VSYDAYIRSSTWAKIRQLRIKFDENKCQTCGNTENLEVHHVYDGPPDFNYLATLGKEKLLELITLCRICHEAITDGVRRRRHSHTKYPTFKKEQYGKNVQNSRDSSYADAQWPTLRPTKRVDQVP